MSISANFLGSKTNKHCPGFKELAVSWDLWQAERSISSILLCLWDVWIKNVWSVSPLNIFHNAASAKCDLITGSAFHVNNICFIEQIKLNQKSKWKKGSKRYAKSEAKSI